MSSIFRELMRVSREMMGYRNVSPFFSSSEMNLPEKARQSVNTKDELFLKACEANGYMLDWLNRGRGLDKQLGLRRVDLNPNDLEGFFREFDKPGAVLVFPSMKGEDRATEKVETDYDGDWARLVDVIRATIAVERYEDLQIVVNALRDSGMVLARRPEDSFVKQSAWGFRRLKVNVVYPNGHIGEVQIHLKGIFRVCVQVHKLYRKAQDIAIQAQEAGRDWLTAVEAEVVYKLTRFIFDKNEEAWRQYASVMASNLRFSFMEETAYYEYGGHPVEAGVWKFPVLFVGGKRIVIYDLARLLSKATGITKDEFDLMMAGEKGKA